MNRLAGMTTYLIGAMDRVEGGGEAWRDMMTPWLQKRGVFIFNPCKKLVLGYNRTEQAGRDGINKMKADGRYDEIRPMYGDEIRGVDMRMVDESSFLVCNLNMQEYPCGTHEEWVTANRSKKPIIVVNPHGKASTPNWLFLAIPHQFIFGSFDEAKDYLNHIDTFEGEVETFRRWRFFDRRRMMRETIELYGEF